MAQVATPTSLAFSVTNTDAATFDTSSVSPTADALIVVAIGFTSGGDETLDSVSSAFSVTAAGWTIAVDSGSFGSDNTRSAIAWAIATGSPGSGAVTVDFSGNFDTIKVDILQITADFDTTTPIAQTDSAGETSPGDGTFTDTFSSTPDANSILVATAIGSSFLSGTSPSGGYTELNDDINGNVGWISMWADGSEGTSYGVVFGATPDDSIAMCAVEIQEEQAAGISIPVVMHHRRQMQ